MPASSSARARKISRTGSSFIRISNHILYTLRAYVPGSYVPGSTLTARSRPPPVQCREGFFIPLQYPRQELLVALAHLVLLASGPPSGSFRYTPFGASLLPAGPPHALGRLRAASVMNFVVDREKFQKKRRTRRAVSYPPRGRIWFWTMCGSCPFSWGKQCIRRGDRDDETCRLSTC